MARPTLRPHVLEGPETGDNNCLSKTCAEYASCYKTVAQSVLPSSHPAKSTACQKQNQKGISRWRQAARCSLTTQHTPARLKLRFQHKTWSPPASFARQASAKPVPKRHPNNHHGIQNNISTTLADCDYAGYAAGMAHLAKPPIVVSGLRPRALHSRGATRKYGGVRLAHFETARSSDTFSRPSAKKPQNAFNRASSSDSRC